MNGVQMLRLVREAYRLFLLSGVFQNEYHFDEREEREEQFCRQAELCSSHERLFDFLADTCKKNMEDASAWFRVEKAKPINQAKRYIKKHFADPISLGEVSSEVGFSGSYFSTLFRKETGKNFLEYLTDVRIDEAKVLLRESRMTIENVAKLIHLKDGQTFPSHFHWVKSEDIINRGGGTLLLKLYNDDGEGGYADTDVLVNSDGRSYYVPAGTEVEVKPGESITLWPHQYHSFAVVPGSGDILIGEVSMCNDDTTDNRFHYPVGHFPEIEEDEVPYRLLCNEYPAAE